jgi:hypothetical protein
VSIWCDSEIVTYIENGLKAVANTVRFVAAATATVVKKLNASWSKWTRAAKANVIMMLITEVAVAIGLFLSVALVRRTARQPAWDQMLVDMIVKILVTVFSPAICDPGDRQGRLHVCQNGGRPDRVHLRLRARTINSQSRGGGARASWGCCKRS